VSLEEGQVEKNRIQLFTNTFLNLLFLSNINMNIWIQNPSKSSGHTCWIWILISPDKYHSWSERQS